MLNRLSMISPKWGIWIEPDLSSACMILQWKFILQNIFIQVTLYSVVLLHRRYKVLHKLGHSFWIHQRCEVWDLCWTSIYGETSNSIVNTCPSSYLSRIMDGLVTRDDANEAVDSIVEIWMEWPNNSRWGRRRGQSLKVFARLFGYFGMFWQPSG